MKKWLIPALVICLVLAPVVARGAQPEAPLEVTISLDRTTVAVGQPIKASWTITGGRAPYSIPQNNFYILEENGQESIFVGQSETDFDYHDAAGTSTFTPQFGTSGKYQFGVIDADGRQKWVSQSFAITGSASGAPLTISVQVNKPSAAVGEIVTGSWSATGGSAPYYYYYWWYVQEGTDIEYFLIDSGDTPTVTEKSFSPPYGHTGIFRVSVNDNLGRTASDETTFSIVGSETVEPLGLTLLLDKTTVSAGETITGRWSAQGGTKPYLFSYWWGVREGERDSNILADSQVTITESHFTPAFGTQGDLTVRVTDAAGRFVQDAKEYAITDSPYAEPLILTVNLDQTSVGKDEPITASWSATGGDSPYRYWYTWRVKENQCDEFTPVRWACGTSAVTNTFTPTWGAVGELYVSSCDALGRYSNQIILEFSIVTDEDDGLPGDANGDGAVDIMDLVGIINTIVSGAGPASPANADANGDGSIDIMDLVWVVNRIVGA